MSYQKPLVMMNDDLAEGVYAASGTVEDGTQGAGTGPAASYTLQQTNAWDGNKQYDITFTNKKNEQVPSVTVTLKVKGSVTSIGGNVSGSVNGSTATITFNNYGNGIEANATVGPIYMAVTGTGDFSLE